MLKKEKTIIYSEKGEGESDRNYIVQQKKQTQLLFRKEAKRQTIKYITQLHLVIDYE